jgi:hypothetical protein
VFGDDDRELSFESHIAKAHKWKQRIEAFGPEKLIVGEWTGALHDIYEHMDKDEAFKAWELYVDTQEFAFAGTAGDYYWNYKSESPDAWNFRHFSRKK